MFWVVIWLVQLHVSWQKFLGQLLLFILWFLWYFYINILGKVGRLVQINAHNVDREEILLHLIIIQLFIRL